MFLHLRCIYIVTAGIPQRSVSILLGGAAAHVEELPADFFG